MFIMSKHVCIVGASYIIGNTMHVPKYINVFTHKTLTVVFVRQEIYVLHIMVCHKTECMVMSYDFRMFEDMINNVQYI